MIDVKNLTKNQLKNLKQAAKDRKFAMAAYREGIQRFEKLADLKL